MESNPDRRKLVRARRSLGLSATLVMVGLAAAVALLLGAVADDLPGIAGLDYRVVQIGVVALAIGFSAYTIERERNLRRVERELEAQRLEGDRLRAMDEMKNALLQSISHDLRTPLTVIVGMAHLLEGKGDDLPAERLREAAQSIGTQARRLDGMLTDLLDIERVARGMVRLQSVHTDVADVVREAVDAVGVSNHPVELVTAPVPMRVDPALVERMIDNLVRNAVKYTPDGTPIWVRVAPEPGGVRISVEDAGPGVPDHLKTAIFELFGRGDPPAGTTGTGVGLSLVRQFSELHGGRAWVEDRPGGGAAFQIVLAEAPPEDDPDGSSPADVPSSVE